MTIAIDGRGVKPRHGQLWVALMLAGLAGAAQAQSGGNPLDRLPLPAAAPAPRVAPKVDVQPPAGPAANRLEQVITPTRFDIEGVGALPFDEIARLFAPSAQQPVPVTKLVALAQEATALYRARGYLLSFVYIPDQSFADGVVRVVAVEGYIADIRIEGDAGKAAPELRELAERLRADRPLRKSSVERVSQLMNRLPGLSVVPEAALPQRSDGAATLVLKVRRQQPYNISLGTDVRQPTPRLVITGVLNNALASGGQLSASTLAASSQNEKLLQVGYTQFVGSDGLQLKTSYSEYRGYPNEQQSPGDAIERYNVNRRLELSASYPLLLDAQRSLTLSGGFYAVNNTDTYTAPLTGGQLIDDARMRALYAQLAYTSNTADRSRSASLMLAHGLDGLGAQATETSNVPGVAGINPARLDFTRLAFNFSQRDRFANQWGTGLSLGGQYSPDALATSEQVSFGGQHFGRGYAAGDATGDSGWGVGLELNRLFKVGDNDWLRQVEPYLLVEAARVYTHQGVPMPARLRSIALGTRLSDSRHYTLDLAIAKPTGDPAPSNPGRKARLTMLLTWQLDAR